MERSCNTLQSAFERGAGRTCGSARGDDLASPEEYEAALRRATALLSKATALGAHPGFSELSYNLVVSDGAEGMR